MSNAGATSRRVGKVRIGVIGAIAAAGLLRISPAHAGDSLLLDDLESNEAWSFYSSGATGFSAWVEDSGARSPTHNALLIMTANSPSTAWLAMDREMPGIPRKYAVQKSCTGAAYVRAIGPGSYRGRGKIQLINPQSWTYIASTSFNFPVDGQWRRVQATGNCANSFAGPIQEFYGAVVRIVIDGSDTAGGASFFAVDDASFSIHF
ncbi:MAG TPA: hypothetical protein VJV79_05180 [Polyangiaceae bacterium]|nr:hypothetical protein [Polyangiaceae bacterium]